MIIRGWIHPKMVLCFGNFGAMSNSDASPSLIEGKMT